MGRWDYIIVGQGLAGSCLAIELLKRNKSFLVIDKPQPNSASRVAAGLFNPITGRTMKPTWMADKIFSALKEFYGQAEKTFNKKFLHLLPIYRPFIAPAEQIQWTKETSLWVSGVFSKAQYPEMIHNPFGGAELTGSGFLNTGVFLEAVREMISDIGNLMEEVFDYQELMMSENVQYKNAVASCIIFCDGVDANANPWFCWAPVIKLKGETLVIKTSLPRDIIVNRGIFSVPAEESPDTFFVGSTYSRDASPGNTPAGLEELVIKAKKVFKNDFEILSQNWGHRPTTIDRRPLLGTHPRHKNICFFNGLGTKGVSLAPFFAVHLADWLDGKTELNKEVNIERYYSLYF